MALQWRSIQFEACEQVSCFLVGVEMFPRSFVLAAVLAVIPLFVQAASLDPRIVWLDRDDAWTKFRFSGDLQEGAWLESDVPNDKPHELRPLIFKISLSSAAMLQVTDAWLYGDIFDVSWNDQTVSTSNVQMPEHSVDDTLLTGDPDYDIKGDFDAAFLDAKWSSGSWLLEAGDYEITGRASRVLMEGAGALRVVDVAPVPVPASLALLAGGCAAFGAVSMRRRRSQQKGS